MTEESSIIINETNVDLEEWARQFDEEFQTFCEEEKRRMEENGLILCVIYDDESLEPLNYRINPAANPIKMVTVTTVTM